MEYPREAGREGQYPWLCHHKAVAIADAVLGPRAPAVRQKFNEALMAASVPVRWSLVATTDTLINPAKHKAVKM